MEYTCKIITTEYRTKYSSTGFHIISMSCFVGCGT